MDADADPCLKPLALHLPAHLHAAMMATAQLREVLCVNRLPCLRSTRP